MLVGDERLERAKDRVVDLRRVAFTADFHIGILCNCPSRMALVIRGD
jgi:hypothetical protein